MSSPKLHLPNLSISGLRGIDNVSISQLGRVTLFAGKNGVGKTTLLDAVRIYASQGQYNVLEKILRVREEVTTAVDEDGDELFFHDWGALFHGRDFLEGTVISIGPKVKSRKLYIEAAPMTEKETEIWRREGRGRFLEEDSLKLKVKYSGGERSILPFVETRRPLIPSRYYRNSGGNTDNAMDVPCESVGPELLNNMDIARFWDRVALTDDERHAEQALRLIFDKVARVAVVGDEKRSRLRGRRVIVKVNDRTSPIPLKSLGDGAVRLFSVALALANSKGGFLLIDEAENGIHHTVQSDFWHMVLTIAQEKNVQVFATTHSWDCVAGFAQASKNLPNVDGRLVRLEHSNDRVCAVEYSEDELAIATKQRIELR